MFAPMMTIYVMILITELKLTTSITSITLNKTINSIDIVPSILSICISPYLSVYLFARLAYNQSFLVFAPKSGEILYIK